MTHKLVITHNCGAFNFLCLTLNVKKNPNVRYFTVDYVKVSMVNTVPALAELKNRLVHDLKDVTKHFFYCNLCLFERGNINDMYCDCDTRIYISSEVSLYLY